MVMNNILDVQITTDIVTEPLLVTEVKNYLHIDFDNDDIFISSLITSARLRLERFTGCFFGSKTVKIYAEVFNDFELPYGPVTSITTVRRWAGDMDFDILTDYVTKGSSFLIFVPESCGEYELTYVTGFTTLPDDIKLAIMTEVAYRYENRGDEITGLTTISKGLAMPYRRLTTI
jgi:uncharacterized phiE125 gp8 family phage protein